MIEDNEFQERAEKIQKDAHAFIDATRKLNPGISYEAAQSTFLWMKLAQIDTNLKMLFDHINKNE